MSRMMPKRYAVFRVPPFSRCAVSLTPKSPMQVNLWRRLWSIKNPRRFLAGPRAPSGAMSYQSAGSGWYCITSDPTDLFHTLGTFPVTLSVTRVGSFQVNSSVVST
jgi:hypothetical protein